MLKIKTGDEVLVLQGRDKGRKGKVEKVLNRGDKILVAGVNIFKKHAKRQGNVPGGIIDISKPLDVFKVSIVCPKCNLPTRVAFLTKEKEKVRICKKCKQQI